MRPQVLIATRPFGSTSEEPWRILNEAGCECSRIDITSATEQQMITAFENVDAAIVGGRPITAAMIAGANRLRVIAMHGVGVNHIDRAAAQSKGVLVANAPGANSDSVADLAFGLMLAAFRRIPQQAQALAGGAWTSEVGIELWQKTIGIVGLGHIGRAVARRAHGFEMSVLAYDPMLTEEAFAASGSRSVSLEELLASSDVVTLHAPSTPATRGLINADRLQLMKRTAFLINTARGDLVDEDALYHALRTGGIAGAGLDAYVEEPPTKSRLLTLPNIVATPHIGSHTKEAVTRASVMSAQNVVEVLRTGAAKWPAW